MDNNNTNIPEITPEDTQPKDKTEEQLPIKEGPTTGEKIAETTGKVVKATGKFAVSGAKAAGTGIFGLITANLQAILIAMAVAAAITAIGFGVKALIDANQIKIMDTATVVTEIKKISEFTTYTYIDELIIHKKKTEEKENQGHLFGIGKKDVPDTLRSEIVMIVSGVTRAGYDLGKISENDIRISRDTISVNLPAIEIFDVIVNPSDTKMFVEEGKWSHEEVRQMQVNCRNQMHQNALDRGILKKANEVGKEKVENLFKALGFKVVTVLTAPVPEVKAVIPEAQVQEEQAPVEEADTAVVS
ncbi:MAG: DUF4230 domain-containing protein [Bacteroidales bacterium]|nr:DUF4230 domain-containing protein [Bacteroidales bacterium]